MSLTYSYLTDYLKTIQPLCDGILGDIQKDAYDNGIPIIPNDVAKLISFVLSVKKPEKILEIGCAIGFSSSLMSNFISMQGTITTIDRFDVMIKKAKENFKKQGLENIITLLEGDAKDILPTIDDKFDVIFMDCAKGQYINILPQCYRLLKVDGILIVDDILQNGTVALERKKVKRRQRTIHHRLRAFLWEITHNPSLRTSILTIGDGVALCHKIKETEGLIISEETQY